VSGLIQWGTRGIATHDVVWRTITDALDTIAEHPSYQLVRRVDRGPWELQAILPAVLTAPPTTAEYSALVSLVDRRTHDLMRTDWKAGLEALNCRWLPFYGSYCWTSPMGVPGAFRVRRLKALALSVPVGSGWEALTPVDVQPEQLELFEVAHA
jgi:hypothetical protein